MLREVISEDEKLLHTFRMLNEMTLSRKADDPNFVLKTERVEGSSMIKSRMSGLRKRFSIFTPSKSPDLVTQYRDLLENSMLQTDNDQQTSIKSRRKVKGLILSKKISRILS